MFNHLHTVTENSETGIGSLVWLLSHVSKSMLLASLTTILRNTSPKEHILVLFLIY